MTSGVYILGSLAKMVLSYLDKERIVAPKLRAELAKRGPFELVPIEDWWRWHDRVQEESFQPALGLHIGRCVQLHHLGLLGYLMGTCQTCGLALEAFQKFQPLIHNLNPSLVNIRGNYICITWDDRYGTSTLISNEVLASSFLTNLRTLTGLPDINFHKLSFPGPPPKHYEIYRTLWGCAVDFDAPSMSFELPVAYLLLPIPSYDENLKLILEKQAESLIEQHPRPDPFISELHELIIPAIKRGEVSADRLAGEIGMPLRSFYRALDKRGITFRDLLRTIRYQLAKQHLNNRRIELVDVASLLGYSDQSAFTRAFKSWHGTTPRQYRLNSQGASEQADIL